MHRTAPLALALLALALVPTSSAEAPSLDCVRSPPCGIITPTMDIDLEKRMCALGKTQFTDEERVDCAPLPVLGGSLQLPGIVTWGWKVSDDGTYPNDPTEDIVITFPRAAGTPDWVDVKVEPESFTISTTTLLDPAYLRLDLSAPTNPGLYYHYEQPITVTITRTGEPTAEDLAKLDEQRQPPQGILPVFVKGRSNPSGAYFTGAFAVDIVQFDTWVLADGAAGAGSSATNGKESPLAAPALLAAALAVAALLRRRW